MAKQNEDANARRECLAGQLDESHYKTHFLYRAIFDVRFLPLIGVETKIGEIQRNLLEAFPVLVQRVSRGLEIDISEGISRATEGAPVYRFLDRDEASYNFAAVISRNNIGMEIRNYCYKDSTDFLKRFMTIWTSVSKVVEMPEKLFRRIGLRFINRFSKEEFAKRNFSADIDDVFWPKFFSNAWVPDGTRHERWASEDHFIEKEFDAFVTLKTAFQKKSQDSVAYVDIDSSYRFPPFGATEVPQIEIALKNLHRVTKLWFEFVTSDDIRKKMR